MKRTVLLRDLIIDARAYNRVAAVAAFVASQASLPHLTTAVLECRPTTADDPLLNAFSVDLFTSLEQHQQFLLFMRQTAANGIHQSLHFNHDNTRTDVHPSLGAFFGFQNLSLDDAILLVRNPATGDISRVRIPQGHMIICRRDCVHAGTFYTTHHAHIHFNWMGDIDAKVQGGTFPFTV